MPDDPMAPHDALAALAAKERFLRESQRIARIGSYDFDIPAGTWRCSPVMDEIFGIDSGYGHTIEGWLALVHPDDRAAMQHYLLDEVVGRGVRFDREYRIIDATTKAVKWLHGLGQLESAPDGRPLRMIGTIQDISERKRAAEALAESHRTYREIFNATSDALFIHDENGRIIDVNDSMCAMYRCTREQALAMQPDQASEGRPPYSRAEAVSHVRKALEQGPQLFSWHARRHDGELFWTEVALRACRISGQQRIVASVRDISERKRAESQLHEQQQTITAIVETSQDWIWAMDLTGQHTFSNQAVAHILGWSAEEFIDLGLELMHPEDRAAVEAEWPRWVAAKQGWRNVVARWRHRDGRYKHLESSAVPILDADGSLRGYRGVDRDISERKRATEERDHFFTLSQDLLCIGTLDGQLLKQVNPAWTRVLGWSAEELTSRPYLEFVHPDDHASTLAACAGLQAGKRTLTFENRYRCKDGSHRLLSWNSTLLVEDGLFFGVARDLTETRRNEERLRQMEKMDAIGQLAGGVAHDFNNQLGGIMGYAEMLAKRLDDPQLKRFAANILTASHRAADLTRELLAFARKGQYLRTTVDLHEIVAETAGILSRSIDRRITIVQQLRAPNASVLGDPTQLQNALLNLGLNARDAMPEGGTLTFASDVVRPQPGGELPDGSYLQIRAIDTGRGLSAEAKAHLFEPFFTTKGPGKGTGMGLAATYGTVRNHGGAISATSAPGQGTCFTILLPLAAAQAGSAHTVQQPVPPLRQLRILVVDDEPMMRELLGEILAAEGHRVIQAANGRDAIDVFRQHDGERGGIDLVILDMVMPEMNGRDCFRVLRRLDPRIRVLLASGYSLDGDAQAILDDGAQGFVQKPCRRDELLRQIGRVIECRAP